MKQYEEEDLLLLSGIQHFAFCERQWGLIHVEGQWVENLRTAEGRLLHQRVDDPFFTESRGEMKIIRSVPLLSRTLGLYGIADVLEIHSDQDSSEDPSYSLVEYKRGKPKPDDRDEVQLCAQAVCLEEMLGLRLDHGYMFYGETKRRHRVEFNDLLRTRVKTLADKMHLLFAHGITPSAVKGPKCKLCSMADICLPKICGRNKNVDVYITSILKDIKEE